MLQTNCSIDGSPLFVSTDTVGMNQNRSEVALWGRVLGITQAIKDKYTTITRGFVLHDYKGGTMKDPKGSVIPDPESAALRDSLNGLYNVILPKSVTDTIDSNKDYWYRAYIKIDESVYYGEPKKLSPLSIEIGDIDWTVHGNKATLHSSIQGTVFVREKRFGTDEQDTEETKYAKTGFVVGKNADISLDKYETLCKYQFKENEQVTDSTYSCVMSVPKDTVYWVRAYIIADGKTRYSEARQFGLDYVDLGLPSKRLWANISVGSAYPEDESDFFAIGEASTKAH